MASKLPQLEVLIGRSLAMCAHPYAAWRLHSTKGRLLVLVAYLAASYFIMLSALVSFGVVIPGAAERQPLCPVENTPLRVSSDLRDGMHPGPATPPHDLVFLLDVDNTLLDNDAVIEDL